MNNIRCHKIKIQAVQNNVVAAKNDDSIALGLRAGRIGLQHRRVYFIYRLRRKPNRRIAGDVQTAKQISPGREEQLRHFGIQNRLHRSRVIGDTIPLNAIILDIRSGLGSKTNARRNRQQDKNRNPSAIINPFHYSFFPHNFHGLIPPPDPASCFQRAYSGMTLMFL